MKLFFLQHLEVHETIAECMIFANHWVAKKIAQAFPSKALVCMKNNCIFDSQYLQWIWRVSSVRKMLCHLET